MPETRVRRDTRGLFVRDAGGVRAPHAVRRRCGNGARITLGALPVLEAKNMRFKVAMNTDELTRSVDETEATNVYE
ncbi:MAG: hypothetical protein GY711_03885 [bacterium]|nr:hypothetical protein [bacterium]